MDSSSSIAAKAYDVTRDTPETVAEAYGIGDAVDEARTGFPASVIMDGAWCSWLELTAHLQMLGFDAEHMCDASNVIARIKEDSAQPAG